VTRMQASTSNASTVRFERKLGKGK
jgi:hypothetical protein